MKTRLLRTAAVMGLSAAMLLPSLAQARNTFNTNQIKAIGPIIKDYLMKNPEVLVQAMEALQAKKRAESAAQSENAIKSNMKAFFNKKNPTMGRNHKDIWVAEFYDYRCGHCKKAVPLLQGLIDNNKDVGVVLMNFPIFGGDSLIAAQASLAAYSINHNDYKKFHKSMLSVKEKLDKTQILALAEKAGYNPTQLEQVMQEKWVEKQIAAIRQLGSEVGVRGTPSFAVINTKNKKVMFLPGALPANVFQQVITEIR